MRRPKAQGGNLLLPSLIPGLETRHRLLVTWTTGNEEYFAPTGGEENYPDQDLTELNLLPRRKHTSAVPVEPPPQRQMIVAHPILRRVAAALQTKTAHLGGVCRALPGPDFPDRRGDRPRMG